MSREIQFYPVGPQETGLRERMENVFIEIAEERKMNEQENVVPLIENKVLFPEIYDFYGTGRTDYQWVFAANVGKRRIGLASVDKFSAESAFSR